MSNVYKLPDLMDATAEACEWLARLDRGLTAQEERELRDWLAGGPKRAKALIEAAEAWDGMGSLSRLADLFPRPIPRQPRQARLALALAASVLLAVALTLFALLKPQADEERRSLATTLGYRQLFETAVGAQSTMRLPDGSELTLNTGTRIVAEFDDKTRTLRLERGEIYVKVAHDETRPLSVWVGDRVVRAVGTAFSVEITDEQQVEVIVTDGKVLIGVVKGELPVTDTSWLEQAGTPLGAGERAVLSSDAAAEQPTIEPIDVDEIDVKLSWRTGNLVFHGEPLVEALGEMARYTRVEFVIKDEELKTIHVAGLFKPGDVDGLLNTLRQNFNISYERVGAETILLKAE